MQVAIAGAHGQVARHLTRELVARGDRVRGIIRNPDQTADIRDDGAEAWICDLEHATAAEVAEALAGCDATVFAAGAGPGSGAQRKGTMDRDGAVLLMEAARDVGVRRYVMLSAMGTDEPPEDDPSDDDDVFAEYLRAKAAADEALMASDRDWTVIRPGGLTDDPPTGMVDLRRHVPRGQVPRADVAGVLAAVLHDDRAIGRVLELVAGDTPIDEALAALPD